jgi:hypothetical protein
MIEVHWRGSVEDLGTIGRHETFPTIRKGALYMYNVISTVWSMFWWMWSKIILKMWCKFSLTPQVQLVSADSELKMTTNYLKLLLKLPFVITESFDFYNEEIVHFVPIVYFLLFLLSFN